MSAAVSASLTVQLITVSIITLQRQLSHNRLANRNEWNSEYDFVVVGAGTAGCVVAARLSENTNFNVLLIEAGGPETVITDIPTLLNDYSDTLWRYTTTEQLRTSFAYRSRTVSMISGRIIGGTNTVNGLIYTRGNRRGYDEWADKYGAIGWSYDEVLPYFIRSENNSDRNIVRNNPGYHGTSGPLTVSSAATPDPIVARFVDSLNLFGYPTNDPNGESQFGTAIAQMLIDANEVRGSTSHAYLRPAITRRTNLHVITRSLVTNILTRRTANHTIEAYGLSFARDGRQFTVTARREVILSAGAINSPQLLMLSGIGPADHLRQFGIPVVADLPVGDNLMDSIQVDQLFIANNPSDIDTHPDLNVANLYEYYTRGTGPLRRVTTTLTHFSSALNGDLDWPDGLLVMFPLTISNNVTELTDRFRAERMAEWRTFYAPLVSANRRIVSFRTINVRAGSRGTVRLASRDPTVSPLIDPNYYSDPRDLAVHVALISRVLEIQHSSSFRLLMTANPLPIPGCQPCGPSVPLYRCHSYITCMAQSLSRSDYHPSGTCRMGSATDPKAVVDERLRVRGVSRLRVMDASVFPAKPNSGPNCAVIMVAEMGADLVKRNYS